MTTAELRTLSSLKANLRALAASRDPIVVGPWLGEVGFEVLYWIPWLRWAVAFAGLRPEQLVIVSRGGARSWYDGLAGRYVDVLEAYTPAALVVGNRFRVEEQRTRLRRASTKQLTATTFEREVLEALELGRGRVLPPADMYTFFRAFWRRRAPRLYHRSSVVRRLVAPAHGLELPASYVAAKFYSSPALPETPATRAAVAAIVAELVEETDVVLLHSPTRYDDHGEFPVDPHPRIHRVELPPVSNLDVQTAIVGGATRYVGTYGGFAYLAPFLGVPTAAWFAEANFRRDHLELMAEIARVDLGVPFDVRAVAAREERRRVA